MRTRPKQCLSAPGSPRVSRASRPQGRSAPHGTVHAEDIRAGHRSRPRPHQGAGAGEALPRLGTPGRLPARLQRAPRRRVASPLPLGAAVPILKPISGHASCAGVYRYLTRNGGRSRATSPTSTRHRRKLRLGGRHGRDPPCPPQRHTLGRQARSDLQALRDLARSRCDASTASGWGSDTGANGSPFFAVFRSDRNF